MTTVQTKVLMPEKKKKVTLAQVILVTIIMLFVLSDRDCPSSQRGCSRICDTELAEKWKYFSILKSLGTGEQSEL